MPKGCFLLVDVCTEGVGAECIGEPSNTINRTKRPGDFASKQWIAIATGNHSKSTIIDIIWSNMQKYDIYMVYNSFKSFNKS